MMQRLWNHNWNAEDRILNLTDKQTNKQTNQKRKKKAIHCEWATENSEQRNINIFMEEYLASSQQGLDSC